VPNELASEAIEALKHRGLTIATAEATTGGLIGHLLTSVPGSSGVFKAGMAPYSNDAKQKLGVAGETLEQFGAVSREAVEAMAKAVRSWAWADVGVAESGIAGPTGGTEERPAGMFWIAVVDGGGTTAEKFTFSTDDREANQRECANAALRLLVRHLR
jgi:PncC family amidohydrolase